MILWPSILVSQLRFSHMWVRVWLQPYFTLLAAELLPGNVTLLFCKASYPSQLSFGGGRTLCSVPFSCFSLFVFSIIMLVTPGLYLCLCVILTWHILPRPFMLCQWTYTGVVLCCVAFFLAGSDVTMSSTAHNCQIRSQGHVAWQP